MLCGQVQSGKAISNDGSDWAVCADWRVAKRFATAMVDLDMPYFTGTIKALCMEHPIQEIIIGNIPGASDPQEVNVQTGNVVHKPNENTNTNDNSQNLDKHNERNKTNNSESIVAGGAEATSNENAVVTIFRWTVLFQVKQMTWSELNMQQQFKLVQWLSVKTSQRNHWKKVPTISGLDISVDKMKQLQADDESFKKSWALSKQTMNKDAKFGYVANNGLLYRAQRDKRDGEYKFQLVVPKELREKVMSLVHKTLLSGHRNTNKTIARITSKFWGSGHVCSKTMMDSSMRYESKKLLDRERNYSVGEREALAILWAVSKFYRYLYGTHFVLESHHHPLQYLNTSDSQNPRVMRWSLAFQPFRYTVKYIRGEDNFCADYLSRCQAEYD